MTRLNWPTAFALVFGALPALALLLAVLCVYPAPALSFAFGAACFVAGDRIGRRRAAIAERAAVEYRSNAALIAAPLPELPTVPARAVR